MIARLFLRQRYYDVQKVHKIVLTFNTADC